MPVLYVTTKLITLLTAAGQLPLSWKRKTQTPFKFSYLIKTNYNNTFPHTPIFRYGLTTSEPLKKIIKISVTRRHDMNSGQIKYFGLMSIIWQRKQTFQHILVLFGRIQIDTGILHIHSCCNINRFFNLTIECSYDLQEDKRSLSLITLLSGCCDGDDLCLLWSDNFIWMIHDPCVNWIYNLMEPTHLKT